MRPCACLRGDRAQFDRDPGVVLGVELRSAPADRASGRRSRRRRAPAAGANASSAGSSALVPGLAEARGCRRRAAAAALTMLPTPRSCGAPGARIQRHLVRAEVQHARLGARRSSCVPLPWWTSKSTIATRVSPCRSSACAAATATLLNRQKPIARRRRGVVAGRAHGAEGAAHLRRRARSRPRRRRRPPRAARPRPSPATARCRDRAAPRRRRSRLEHGVEQRGGVHAQQLAPGRARRFAPVEAFELAQRLARTAPQALRAFGVAGAGVVRQAGGMGVDPEHRAVTLAACAALVVPEHFAVAAVARQHARQHEQQVGKAVEVADRLRPHRVVVRQGHGLALGAADDGARDVAAGRGFAAAGQDEILQRRQRLVVAVEVLFEALDVGVVDGGVARECRARRRGRTAGAAPRSAVRASSVGSSMASSRPSAELASSTVP